MPAPRVTDPFCVNIECAFMSICGKDSIKVGGF